MGVGADPSPQMVKYGSAWDGHESLGNTPQCYVGDNNNYPMVPAIPLDISPKGSTLRTVRQHPRPSANKCAPSAGAVLAAAFIKVLRSFQSKTNRSLLTTTEILALTKLGAGCRH